MNMSLESKVQKGPPPFAGRGPPGRGPRRGRGPPRGAPRGQSRGPPRHPPRGAPRGSRGSPRPIIIPKDKPVKIENEFERKIKEREERAALRKADDSEIAALTKCWACPGSRTKLSECMCGRNWEEIMRITGNKTETSEGDKKLIKAKIALTKALKKGLLKIGRKPLLRAKLMVVGKGEAGKTCTVNTLCHKKFDKNPESTIGIATLETMLLESKVEGERPPSFQSSESEYSRAINELMLEHMQPGDSFLSKIAPNDMKKEYEATSRLERELIAALPSRKERVEAIRCAITKTQNWAKEFFDEIIKTERESDTSNTDTLDRSRSSNSISRSNFISQLQKSKNKKALSIVFDEWLDQGEESYYHSLNIVQQLKKERQLQIESDGGTKKLTSVVRTDLLDALFKHLDVDHSGSISHDEWMQFFDEQPSPPHSLLRFDSTSSIFSDHDSHTSDSASDIADIKDLDERINHAWLKENHASTSTSTLEASSNASNLDLMNKPKPIRWSIWDFGGQECFHSMHHIFLTRYGVYLVCFRLNFPDKIDWEDMLFWMKSIKLHAPSAPIFVVGTHRKSFLDEQNNKNENKLEDKDIRAISAELQKRLKKEGGNFKIQYNRNLGKECCIFPIENNPEYSEQRDKELTEALLSGIDHAARKVQGVENELPISWFQFYDKMAEIGRAAADYSADYSAKTTSSTSPRHSPRRPNNKSGNNGGSTPLSNRIKSQSDIFGDDEEEGTTSSVLTLEKVKKIGTESGLHPSIVIPALEYMHELGIVHFINEPQLNSHVILNPQYLIDAIGKLIRNWDKDYHTSSNNLALEQINNGKDFEQLKSKGKVTTALLEEIWKNDYSKKEKDMLIKLMDKFGLLCEWNKIGVYLVPSLLRNEDHFEKISKEEMNKNNHLVFYIHSEKTIPYPYWSRLMCYIVRRANVSSIYSDPPETDYVRTTVRTFFEKYRIQADYLESEQRIRVVIFNDHQPSQVKIEDQGGAFVLKLMLDMAQAVADDFFTRSWLFHLICTQPGNVDIEIDYEALKRNSSRDLPLFSNNKKRMSNIVRQSDEFRKSSVSFHKVADYICWLEKKNYEEVHVVQQQQEEISTSTVSVRSPLKMNQQEQIPLPEGCKYHFFISHHQKKGGDIASTLYWKLTICGYKVWQDIQMDEIDTTAMQEGIDNSHCFILLLTTGVLTRPFVRFEINRAIDQNKKIITIKLPGEDKYDFTLGRENCAKAKTEKEHPGDYYQLLFEHLEAITYRRRNFEADAMIAELVRRSKIPQKPQERRSLPRSRSNQMVLPTIQATIQTSASTETTTKKLDTIETTKTIDTQLATSLSNTFKKFKKMDLDSNGVISASEFASGSSAMAALIGGNSTDQGLMMGVFSKIDKNNDGVLDEQEFINGYSEITALAGAAVLNNFGNNTASNLVSNAGNENKTIPSLSISTPTLDIAEMVYDAARTIKELRKLEGKKKWPKGTKKLVKQCKQKIMKDSFEPNEFEKLTKHLQRVTKQKRFVQGNEEVRNLMVVEELLEFYDWDGSSDDDDDADEEE